MKTNYALYILILLCTSCKEEWLEKKRDIKLVVPTTLADLKLLLQYEQTYAKDYLNIAELSADDYYIPDALFGSSDLVTQNAYLWKKDVFEGVTYLSDWDNAYNQILTANVALDALAQIEKTETTLSEWEFIRGASLFLRAKAMFNLNQQFSVAYNNEAEASSDLGTPIKLTPEVNEKIERSSLTQNYELIVNDLLEAVELLDDTPDFITDPSKGSVYGFLARVSLVMNKYNKAEEFATKYLTNHSDLMDFNDLNASVVPYAIPQYNIEITQYSEIGDFYLAFSHLGSRIKSEFYDLYDDNDLRKSIFFRNRTTGESGTFAFRGTYAVSSRLFSGIATDEIFLIRSECRARLGNVAGAMDDLNGLLITRWKKGTFVPYEEIDEADALEIVLLERRKELLRRGLRWSDLRRLNLGNQTKVTINRTLADQEYTLPPNDLKYVIPIPQYVINLNGIEQNPR